MDAQETLDLLSSGQLSQILQQAPSRIIAAAGDSGIHPRFRLNNVPYYDSDDLPQIRAAVAAFERTTQKRPGVHRIQKGSR